MEVELCGAEEGEFFFEYSDVRVGPELREVVLERSSKLLLHPWPGLPYKRTGACA